MILELKLILLKNLIILNTEEPLIIHFNINISYDYINILYYLILNSEFSAYNDRNDHLVFFQIYHAILKEPNFIFLSDFNLSAS